MARIRTIKPEILEDEKTSVLSDAAYRLFTAMIFLADDHGNVRADARWLSAQIWWAHREPPRVAEILREVSDAGLITLYEVRGGIYARLNGWEKHQRIDNAGKPRVPTPNDPDCRRISASPSDARGGSPRDSANLGETPLDPDLGPRTKDLGPSEGEAAASPPLAAPRPRSSRAPRERADSTMPSDWGPNEAHRSRASELRVDLAYEASQFRDHAIARGLRYADWDAAFRTWLGKSAKWRDERGGSRQGAQPEIRSNLQPL